MNTKILTLFVLIIPAQSFVSPRRLVQCRGKVPHLNLSVEGGTDWIKDAMGEDGPKNEPEFSQSEISDMESLIVTLSKESNDEKRREKLKLILDKELKPTESVGDNLPVVSEEMPRFAKLFQLSLDNVGERVQNTARERALERQDHDDGAASEGNEGETVERIKSEEELQLWALIDIMVQSKTAVKLHMGSLGSKGSFR